MSLSFCYFLNFHKFWRSSSHQIALGYSCFYMMRSRSHFSTGVGGDTKSLIYDLFSFYQSYLNRFKSLSAFCTCLLIVIVLVDWHLDLFHSTAGLQESLCITTTNTPKHYLVLPIYSFLDTSAVFDRTSYSFCMILKVLHR